MKRTAKRWSSEDDADVVRLKNEGRSWRQIRKHFLNERTVQSVKVRHWLLTSKSSKADHYRDRYGITDEYLNAANMPVKTTSTSIGAKEQSAMDMIASVGMSNMRYDTKVQIIKSLAEQL